MDERNFVQESLESANRIPVSHSPGIFELPAQHLKSSVYTVAPLLVLVLLIAALNFVTVLPSVGGKLASCQRRKTGAGHAQGGLCNPA